MTPTQYRDQAAALAKTDIAKAAKVAEGIKDPWFQAQAWSHLARYADRPLQFSRKAAKSASLCKDNFQGSTVRAWEIVALAERNYSVQARRSRAQAVELAQVVEPVSSRSEAFLLLFQAAYKISVQDASVVAEILRRVCASEHWRAKRAGRDVEKMLTGLMRTREFYW
jgi:hypothetical protein